MYRSGAEKSDDLDFVRMPAHLAYLEKEEHPGEECREAVGDGHARPYAHGAVKVGQDGQQRYEEQELARE